MNFRTTCRLTFSAAPRLAALAAAAVIGSTLLGGCAVLLGGAVVGGALSYSDRRTSGTQLEDEAIELKAVSRVNAALSERGHVNITSYNRSVLITGEVPTDADRLLVEQTVARVENVRATTNELMVGFSSSLGTRSNDTILTSKVKATFIDTKDLQSNALKVVTERSVVYLLGQVTEREAGRAADVARGVGGVAKVVRVFEVISEAELANLLPK
jgi:osmotically-inducible protein OsmY